MDRVRELEEARDIHAYKTHLEIIHEDTGLRCDLTHFDETGDEHEDIGGCRLCTCGNYVHPLIPWKDHLAAVSQ